MPTQIHSELRTIDRRLSQYFNSTRAQWIDIVRAAVAARAGCTENDARSAPGFYAWNAATARARQIFRREGWEKGDHEGIETIWNADHRKMIAVMNCDAGTCALDRVPHNRTPKGNASDKVVALNTEMFKPSEMTPLERRPYSFWYLCIFDDGRQVRAEISRPVEYKGNQIVDYSERIFILQDGEWERIIVETPSADDGQDFDIDVRRK
jgi:hypothetical protein